jgi:hypothetical protein
MKLDNPFPERVRLLYLYERRCLLCHANGWGRGGLELHHILGRSCNCVFNAALLCGLCHKGMVHNSDEHLLLGGLQIRWLKDSGITPLEEDWSCLQTHYKDLISQETEVWLLK